MLLPENISVDWVGTGPAGRSKEENEKAIKRFCPAKDKITKLRAWDLDILINVGLAGEGLDSIDVTEIVFLTPANLTITNKQTIGRAARPMRISQQPKGHINVDTGTPMAQYIGEDVMKLFDEDLVEIPEEKTEPREPNEYDPLPERLGWMIADVNLDHIRSEPMFKEILKRARAAVDLIRTDEEIAQIVEQQIQQYLNRSNNASAIYAQKREQIDTAVSKIAGLMIRRLSNAGLRIERTLAGDLRRRINTRKKIELGSISDSLDENELEKHYQWLRNLERMILLEQGLQGVPQWLR
jgi:hypothetical protein